MGARALVDYKIGPVTLTLEGDYATGDADPRSDTAITSYSYARDVNVGLLLFEHILAFESARSVAVGVENLSSLDAASFPISEASTEGRFTNAIVLFPQLKVDLVDSPRHKVHTRFGVLFAWPEADGVVDPIMTILSEDGTEITDDAVNFHGGKPGDYYGTEYDLQVGWVYEDRFHWILEGAMLMPGNSLQDEHGDAVPSFLFENRFLFPVLGPHETHAHHTLLLSDSPWPGCVRLQPAARHRTQSSGRWCLYTRRHRCSELL